MNPILPVILSGGSGTRLWPLSREAYPKQFLPLVGEDTMLQATWKRVAPVAGAAPIVVANYEHRFMAAEQLRECGAAPSALILEPVGRNTAPAIAVADKGFTVNETFSHLTRENERKFQQFSTTSALYLRNGKAVTPGTRLRNPDMAKAAASAPL